ncbi:MAG: 50S ribosomal protein L29 [Anaerolineae bacterium]|nr:50S ribosomal protein L29 [Anaerolineae bacterium]MCA9887491.1 50S ribosomal protein L29 [Anaerolineae bacterium]MCA9891504.1 50S ribosomal protein L29 [Anaerolineae bacterium]MCB9461991.1 50S ribosomal protein L29 [Anaerolineaceae bacterium]
MPAILSGELRAMSDEALQDKLEELKQDMLTMRLNYSIGELTDTSEFKKARRTIARIETIMREREHAAQIASEES